MLVASTGGHLEELHRLTPRIVAPDEYTEWATFDDPQSYSLLEGQRVHHVRYVPPRGYRAATSNLVTAQRILRQHRFARLVTTGAGIALPFVVAARVLGVQTHYVESAARATGPSLTGSFVSRVPGVRLYTQYPGWASERWNYRGSLFDRYRASPTADGRLSSPGRVVVTLGTMRSYGFGRAVRRLVEILPSLVAADAEILWQVGATDTEGLGIAARDRIPALEMTAAIADADLVIAHAGVGSSLTALDHGRCPVLLPRRRVHGEHVDDHQQLIGSELAGRGLAICRDPDDLTVTDLAEAMSTTVRTVEHVDSFDLVE